MTSYCPGPSSGSSTTAYFVLPIRNDCPWMPSNVTRRNGRRFSPLMVTRRLLPWCTDAGAIEISFGCGDRNSRYAPNATGTRPRMTRAITASMRFTLPPMRPRSSTMAIQVRLSIRRAPRRAPARVTAARTIPRDSTTGDTAPPGCDDGRACRVGERHAADGAAVAVEPRFEQRVDPAGRLDVAPVLPRRFLKRRERHEL